MILALSGISQAERVICISTPDGLYPCSLPMHAAMSHISLVQKAMVTCAIHQHTYMRSLAVAARIPSTSSLPTSSRFKEK